MKKITLIVASLVLLTSVGIGYAVNANTGTNTYETSVTENNTSTNMEAIQSDVAGISSIEEVDSPNQVNHDGNDDETVEPKTELAEFEEYTTLINQVDITSLDVQVVKDNKGKRIILLKDGNGNPQYKSIYVKDKNRLKIINLSDGLLYNGTI